MVTKASCRAEPLATADFASASMKILNRLVGFKRVIEAIIVPEMIWNGQGFGSAGVASLNAASMLFDIVDVEEREMRTAESWRSQAIEATDFGGSAFLLDGRFSA